MLSSLYQLKIWIIYYPHLYLMDRFPSCSCRLASNPGLPYAEVQGGYGLLGGNVDNMQYSDVVLLGAYDLTPGGLPLG